jgi:hypothetical protein
VINVWWEHIPGLDWRYPYGDEDMRDRLVALACAGRVRGTDPLGLQAHDRRLERTADVFFAFIRPAEDAQDGHVRRLALAITCGGGVTDTHDDKIVKAAEWIRSYLTRPPGKRGGGWI